MGKRKPATALEAPKRRRADGIAEELRLGLAGLEDPEWKVWPFPPPPPPKPGNPGVDANWDEGGSPPPSPLATSSSAVPSLAQSVDHRAVPAATTIITTGVALAAAAAAADPTATITTTAAAVNAALAAAKEEASARVHELQHKLLEENAVARILQYKDDLLAVELTSGGDEARERSSTIQRLVDEQTAELAAIREARLSTSTPNCAVPW